MMENSNNECPTEILVDLKESDFIPSCVKYKEIQTSINSQKPMKRLEDKENVLSETRQEKYQCIMDMSPFRLKKRCDLVKNSFTNSEQVSKGAAEDCPTAVLIEVPNNSCPKQCAVLNDNTNDSYQDDAVVKCESVLQGVKKKECLFFGKKKCRVTEESDNPYDFTAMRNELSPPRLRWRTPSPQSMSRISKEATRIIHNLNSSLLDDDSPLCEEILPLPINFDLDENSDQENLTARTENATADGLSDLKSVSIQTEEGIISPEMISKKVSDISSSSVIENGSSSSEYQNSLTQSPSESFKNPMNFQDKENSSEDNTTSEEISSSEWHSGSHDNYENYVCDKETNDVFIENDFSSEDKENILEREEKEFLPKKVLTKCKTAENISSASKKQIKNRKTLINLSNIRHSIGLRNSLNTNKINVAPNLKQNKVNPKEFLYHGKQQLKKTTSVELRTVPKRMSFGSSFHSGSTREAISTFQRPASIKQKTLLLSDCKSSSSDVKNSLTQMRTPSRRYSIATPLRSASAKKPALTPALSNFRNPPVPRFTPHSAGGTRLSFSKSWQQSNASNSKSFRYQNSIPTSSAVEKLSHNQVYTPNMNKQALNQRISKLSVQASKNSSVSTSSKNRVSSKLSLPSPLLAGDDGKLARALFPSMPPK